MPSTTATDAVPAYEQISAVRRWAILTVGTLAQAAAAVTVHGPAFLIPVLHERHGLSLATAGLVAAAPMIGLLVTLIGWGLVVDRHGERFALLTGLGLAAVAGIIATQVDHILGLALALAAAGAAAAATNSASGRVVVGWFPPHQRGLAMGLRQAAQPLGVAVGAATMAALASGHGISAALMVPAAATAVAVLLVALVVIDPPRVAGGFGLAPNPYAGSWYLQRIHLASVLLVVPQFVVWTFALTWLIDDVGWAAAAAGGLVAATQFVGAAGRIGSGWVSDRMRSRMRPMRGVAVLAAAVMGLLGVTAGVGSTWLAIGLLVAASAITVADNGLAFTAVAERAGASWSGRALGIQNFGQHLVAAGVPPVAGLVITHWGYAAAFMLAAVLPVLAIPVVPVREETPLS